MTSPISRDKHCASLSRSTIGSLQSVSVILQSQLPPPLSAAGFRFCTGRSENSLLGFVPAGHVLCAGLISSAADAVDVKGAIDPELCLNCDVHHGNSGGPVVLADTGEVAGVVVIHEKDVSADITALRDELQQAGGGTLISGVDVTRSVSTALNRHVRLIHLGHGRAITAAKLREWAAQQSTAH